LLDVVELLKYNVHPSISTLTIIA